MEGANVQKSLSVLLGTLRQSAGDGELILRQNDGVRSLYLSQGELIHLRSMVAGEQFGSHLLRKGIFDLRMLEQLLASDQNQRIGVKVIQGGFLNPAERDEQLRELQEMVMVCALERPIHHWAWNPGSKERFLSDDLHFQLQHRHFVWRTFQGSKDLVDLLEELEHQTSWKWQGLGDVLGILSDLPLTPNIAYALTFLSTEPISFETFQFLSNLPPKEAGQLIGTLWALGALALCEGKLPALPPEMPVAALRNLPVLSPQPTPVMDPKGLNLPADQQPPLHQPIPAGQAGNLPPSRIPEKPSPSPLDRTSPQPQAAPPVSEDGVLQLILRARQQISGGRPADAIRTLEEAVSLRPNDDESYEILLMLGNLRMANPAWSAKAIANFRNAARIHPEKAEPWIAMGAVYRTNGFDLDATNCYLKARKLEPAVQVPADMDFSDSTVPNGQIREKGKGPLGALRGFLKGIGTR